jgi:uncharacterized protein (TIGR02271 family)
MFSTNEISEIIGRDVLDSDDAKIGRAGQVYLDDESGQPEWVTVNTGLFGTKESFVPLREATVTEDGVKVPYRKDQVKDAPNVDPDDGHISPQEEDELFRHYGLTKVSAAAGDDYNAGRTQGGISDDDRRDGIVGHDTSGPTTDEAMTRSEEQLKVGTETREAGRARLRKHIVTEQQTVNVPVTREEVTLEREPITDANRGQAQAGPDLSEEEHEVVIHEERPVVDTEVVPVERVKLGKQSTTENVQVTEDVRKETIDADTDGDAGRTGRI